MVLLKGVRSLFPKERKALTFYPSGPLTVTVTNSI